MLMLSGDQVYADDVAGPMLAALHALIRCLGLYGEFLEGALVSASDSLYVLPASYFPRENLLPAFNSNTALHQRLFGCVEKPIFTQAHAHNPVVHLPEGIDFYPLSL